MDGAVALAPIQIGPLNKPHLPLVLGGSIFPDSDRTPETERSLLAAMQTALGLGITHLDTASGYGGGRSEELIGEFLQGQREAVYLASKASINEMDAQLMLGMVEKSLQRLQTDFIDLYYIHWPRSGKDLRPLMEGLELARSQGKIGAIGVSNFSVEQMQQVAEVGTIDAHQLCYNLLWRFAERDVIPYCHQMGIAGFAGENVARRGSEAIPNRLAPSIFLRRPFNLEGSGRRTPHKAIGKGLRHSEPSFRENFGSLRIISIGIACVGNGGHHLVADRRHYREDTLWNLVC